ESQANGKHSEGAAMKHGFSQKTKILLRMPQSLAPQVTSTKVTEGLRQVGEEAEREGQTNGSSRPGGRSHRNKGSAS
ncbi:MAG: hypothetical protein WA628_05055, partial [Terriglobales bacterium]